MKEILQQAKEHSLSDAQIYIVNTAVNLWSQFHEEVPRKDKKKTYEYCFNPNIR